MIDIFGKQTLRQKTDLNILYLSFSHENSSTVLCKLSSAVHFKLNVFFINVYT